MFDLSGQNAIITGASSGLGRQFALALARAGANVALAARRVDRLEALAAELGVLGRKALVLEMDVTDEKTVQVGFEKIEQEWGKLDIAVNNAGISNIKAAEEMTREEWQGVIDVNLTGVFTTAKYAARLMKKNNYGRIISTASMFGLVGNTAFPVANYHASKGGVVNLTRGLAAEWAKYGITVNAIGPGFFDSEMTHDSINSPEFQQYVKTNCPMGRVGREGELDAALLFLASKEASYVTGQSIYVDGGWTSI